MSRSCKPNVHPIGVQCNVGERENVLEPRVNVCGNRNHVLRGAREMPGIQPVVRSRFLGSIQKLRSLGWCHELRWMQLIFPLTKQSEHREMLMPRCKIIGCDPKRIYLAASSTEAVAVLAKERVWDCLLEPLDSVGLTLKYCKHAWIRLRVTCAFPFPA
ncbi:Hypothetical predicted protein [Podarcis lilfordi]|uniref:Uncharacterized protein n=1 Tax=Podarcis lilfordi TaxID=74358 RepID=A0AA35P342_9SAUR|nr:Hypothetical predicted protein [Podarcis lilfordi]